MTTNDNYVPLPGSEKLPLRDVFSEAEQKGTIDPNERIAVSIVLRSRASGEERAEAVEGGTVPLHRRKYITREEYASRHGADSGDIAKVEEFARENELTVEAVHQSSGTVKVSGTVAALSKAFRTELTSYDLPSGQVRGRTGPVQVPADLAPIIVTVTGLDNRPQVTPKLRSVDHEPGGIQPAAAGAQSYTPPQIAQLYSFPPGLDGTGECIAILEFGGGYQQADLTTYFSGLGIPTPTVTSVSVDGGQNAPTGQPNSADGEVLLDIDVAGAVAPKAKIVVYFAPNSSRGFVDAILAAVHDTTNKPSIISISWGGPEPTWTPATMNAMSQAFQSAVAMGISVYVASGDNGSSDGMASGNHVDYPAADPSVTGCGGTHLQSANGAITQEVVWNDPGGGATGGGVSTRFTPPAYQHGITLPGHHTKKGGRGVPDVAGDASPQTGYQVRVDGHNTVFGGTSAVAPLWAGLTALMNQKLGRSVGFLNPLVYGLQSGSGAFNDITVGNNGAYHAGPGWDACTGLGSPNGTKLLQALGSGKPVAHAEEASS